MRQVICWMSAVLCVMLLAGCNLQKPQAAFSANPTTGTVPLTVQFENQSTGGGPFTVRYSWDFGDGSPANTETSPAHVYNTPGRYTVTLKMDTWLGNQELSQSEMVVAEAASTPAVTAAFEATPRGGVAPLAVQFTDRSTEGAKLLTGWEWDFGDGGISTEQHPSHTYLEAGTYTVRLVVHAGAVSDEKTEAGFIAVQSPDQKPSLARSFVPAAYTPGATVDVTLSLAYTGALPILSLGLEEQIPEGWTFEGVVGGTAPAMAQVNPGSGVLEFAYVAVPAFPFQFTYRLTTAGDAQGDKTFQGHVLYRFDAGQLTTNNLESTLPAAAAQEGEGETEGEGEGEDVGGELVYSYDFTTMAGSQDWVSGFADLPENFSAVDYQLFSGRQSLPGELGGASALYIAGDNHSDDLFMYFKRPITGLQPNTTYTAAFTVDFASAYPAGSIGIGGSPGDSVWLKAGIMHFEPNRAVDNGGWYRMNLDKGNQSVGGVNAALLGTIAKPDDGTDQYVALSLESTQPVTVTADAHGAAWLFFGTDSGFEGRTALYYTGLTATLTPVSVEGEGESEGETEYAKQTVLALSRTAGTNNEYTSGGALDVTVTVNRVGLGDIPALTIAEALPTSWTYDGWVFGPVPASMPALNAGGALSFIWTTPPSVPFTFTYTVHVPVNTAGVKTLSGAAWYGLGSARQTSNEEETQLRAAGGAGTMVILGQTVAGKGVYTPGGTVAVTLRLDKAGAQSLSALGVVEQLPAGWTFDSLDPGVSLPNWAFFDGGPRRVEFFWLTPPTLPVEFTFHLKPPADGTGVVRLTGYALYRLSGGGEQFSNTEQTDLPEALAP